MAILKIIAHGKTNAGKRRLLQYVLDSKKTEPHLCAVTGEFGDEEITPHTVYQSYARTRALFNKESCAHARTYTHGTIAFAPGEITPEDASKFSEELVEKIFPAHQVLTAVHTDAEGYRSWPDYSFRSWWKSSRSHALLVLGFGWPWYPWFASDHTEVFWL